MVAARLSSLTQASVTAANDAIPGFQTSDVLRQLTTSSQAISDVSSADVVSIEVGANDVGYSNRCRVNVACYRPQLQSFVRNLRAIVARVQQLSSSHGVTIVLVDYWNVWLGGKYATKRGTAYVRASNALTDQVHALTMATALDTNSVYVDLESAFKGPSYANDETRYLASDGDHANAAGQQLIAKAVMLAVRPALHL
jgi:acyl-CoA thioesterase I